MTPDRATRRKRRRIRLAIRRTSALAAAIAFFFTWGTIGAIETDAVSLVEGTVRTFGLLFIGTGFAFVGGAFRNPTERRSKHEVHRDTVGRPGRTSRQKSSYAVGNIRQYNGELFRCVQAHTSQADWTPDATASLWKKVGDPTEEWPAWSQPIGAHDAYNSGDKVSHNGKHWTSNVDANVWEPGVYGWTEVTE